MMRLLGLHGRYQSSRVFARKLAVSENVVRTGLVEHVELEDGNPGLVELESVQITNTGQTFEVICLDAPHVVEPKLRMKGAKLKPKSQDTSSANGLSLGMRAWWTIEKDGHCKGYEESFRLIQHVVKHKGPFDGVLGFSQGGALGALLCTKIVSDRLEWKPRFGAFFSAYISWVPEHEEFLRLGFLDNLKCIHMFSEYDKMVRIEKSIELVQFMSSLRFNHAQQHLEGHVIPRSWTRGVEDIIRE